jgi:hypothetical protein
MDTPAFFRSFINGAEVLEENSRIEYTLFPEVPLIKTQMFYFFPFSQASQKRFLQI